MTPGEPAVQAEGTSASAELGHSFARLAPPRGQGASQSAAAGAPNPSIQRVTAEGEQDATRIRNRLPDLQETRNDAAFKKTYVPNQVWADLDGNAAVTAVRDNTSLDAISDQTMDAAFTLVNGHWQNWKAAAFDRSYRDDSPQAKHLHNDKAVKSPTYLTELYTKEELPHGRALSKDRLGAIADVWKTPNHDEWMGGDAREKATKLGFAHPAANANWHSNGSLSGGAAAHLTLYSNAVADPADVTVTTDDAMEALFAMHGDAGSVHVTLARYGHYGETAGPQQRNPHVFLDSAYGEDRLDDLDANAAAPPWAQMVTFAQGILGPYRALVDDYLEKRGRKNW